MDYFTLPEDTPYYGGLRDGLRRACRLEILNTVREETREMYFFIERYGNRLHTQVVAEIALIQGHPHALEQTRYEVLTVANRIVDEILDQVDWDTFFEIEVPELEKPEQHPYTAIRTKLDPDEFGFTGFTSANIPAGDFRDVPQLACVKVGNKHPHTHHVWRARQDGTSNYHEVYCLGYHPHWEEK